ncbi:MAG: CotH kinase family protein, partial [Verrucomicrobiota bacterium]
AIFDMARSSFDYDLATMQQLIDLHRVGNGSLNIAGDTWGYAGGLGAVEGLVTNGTTNLVFDGSLGTGLQLGLGGPPPSTGGISTNNTAWFVMPTPGAPNGIGLPDLGPRISDVTGNLPAVPDASDLVITARVEALSHPIGQVRLHYRVMFGPEVIVPMADGGGGIYSATIPNTASAPGQMVRWYVTAEDDQSNPTRQPLFSNSTAAPEYFGTIVQNPGLTGNLPVLHWFIENPAAANNVSGTRASVAYLGEFYDNIFVRRRGQTSANWPKKSFKFEFNEDEHFRFDPNLPRVDEINVNTTYTDKSYVRAVLAFESYRDAGSAACIAFPLRVEQNGAFFSVALFIEQPDRDYLRRNDLDDDGAFYKVVANSIGGLAGFRHPATVGIEKKTRRDEDASDMQALIDGMALSGTALEQYLFDHVDLPACVSYMAASVVNQNIDRTVKNFYLYRDTEGNREWRILPWDVDLTFGPNALNTDAIVSSEDSGNGSSHPFMGTEQHTYTGLWNGLLDAIITTPRSREMFLRRLRTIMDEQLATTYFEDRIDEWVTALNPDVTLDKAAWGANAHFGAVDYTLLAATDRIKTDYLVPRRPHLFTTHTAIGGNSVEIPAVQSGLPPIEFGAYVISPISGNQDEEYIELINTNAVAVDISGWRLDGGIS